ncbi:MAG: flagellar hook-basal body protein [Sporolactobacillus sp.]
MIRGLYTAASGMIAEQRRESMLSNNLNNIDTPGYKQDVGTLRTFPEMLVSRISGGMPVTASVGNVASGVYQDETIPDFSQGTLTQTGQPTDVAIVTNQLPVNPTTGAQDGALLFSVRTAQGDVRYTRNGHFTVSASGRLVDDSGDNVLDAAGNPLQLNTSNVQIAGDGTVTDAATGATLGRIGVSYAADTNQLVKEGDGLYRWQGGGALPAAGGQSGVSYTLKQGELEGSNVSAEDTMTDMMESYRSFEANQKVLQILDSTLNEAVNQVGRLNS